jgi:1,4-dihydroxy-2-naphthoate octaprenyltransferase
MGVRLDDPPHFKRPDDTSAVAGAALKAFSIVRYRFFLYAGLLPYLLGAAWAYGIEGQFRANVFWTGFFGIFLSVVGVEAFNEYFDSRMGTDRVFNPNDEDPIPDFVLYLGIAAFAAAASIGFWLAREGGWPVVMYTLLGGLAAVFYVGPPIRWVYRGLGETMIALSYGPWMTLGSLHLHTHHFSKAALLASMVPGCLIGALAVVNAIPDFHQDRLVGKRNLVVRLGRRNGVFLYTAIASCGILAALIGTALGLFPRRAYATAVAIPLLVGSFRHGIKTYDKPMDFVPAVRRIVVSYLLGTSAFIFAIACG